VNFTIVNEESKLLHFHLGVATSGIHNISNVTAQIAFTMTIVLAIANKAIGPVVSDIAISFSVVGSFVGIVTVFAMLLVANMNWYTLYVVLALLSASLTGLWFLCVDMGMWIEIIYLHPQYPRTWPAELGLQVISSFLWIVLVVVLVGRVENK